MSYDAESNGWARLDRAPHYITHYARGRCIASVVADRPAQHRLELQACFPERHSFSNNPMQESAGRT